MNNFSSKLTAYIPIVLPHRYERNALISEFEKGLSELISLGNNLKIEFENGYEALLSTRRAKDVNEFPMYEEIWEGKPSPIWDFCFLEISAIFKFSKGDVENYIPDSLTKLFTEKKDWYLLLAAQELEKICNDLLLAISLAKSGLITTNIGTTFYDNTVVRSNIRGTNNLFFEAKQSAFECGWPQILELKLEQVWNWLNSFGFLNQSFGEGPIGRAIAAITYLLKDEFTEAVESINLDTIWIFLGLEALYGKGNIGLKNQLIEKSRAFLGEPIKSKKRFSKSYDLRSRVIHGDVDIPFRYCIYEAWDKYENLSSELEDVRLTVLSLLIATVQKLIAEGRTSLDFEYKVLEKP